MGNAGSGHLSLRTAASGAAIHNARCSTPGVVGEIAIQPVLPDKGVNLFSGLDILHEIAGHCLLANYSHSKVNESAMLLILLLFFANNL